MQARVKIDTMAVDRAFQALANYSPVAVRDTLRAEAGSILKTCAGRTKVAKPADIVPRERLRIVKELGYAHGRSGLFDIAITVGARSAAAYGKVWRSTTRRDGTWGIQQTHAPGFQPLNRHYGDAVWTDLKEAVQDFQYDERKRVPLAKKSAGLARQSWVQIADDLGIRLEDVPGGGISPAGIAKAREAIARDGRSYKNGQGSEYGSARDFTIRLTNQLPYASKVRLDSILAGAINGRVKFFERNLALGVFKSLEKTLKAYPGLRIAYRGTPIPAP